MLEQQQRPMLEQQRRLMLEQQRRPMLEQQDTRETRASQAADPYTRGDHVTSALHINTLYYIYLYLDKWTDIS